MTDNPYLRSENQPESTGEAPGVWREKANAWRRGWQMHAWAGAGRRDSSGQPRRDTQRGTSARREARPAARDKPSSA